MKSKLALSFLTLTSLVVSTQSVVAQQIPITQTYTPSNRIPIPDSTLNTQVSGTGGNFDITGGLNKGQTLFHSFTDFSVPTNGAANFLNPVGNRDIITRVTGNVFSDINGLVNTNGANFFLINPSGIVFGTNAQLNVGKAFVGSTANSIDLVGGGQMIRFGTNPSGDEPLLSVAPNVLFDVSRLNLGGGNGQISNFGTLQTNNDSQYIGLIGGNVTLDGGKIIAPGGRIDVGGLKSAGTVTVDNNGLLLGGNALQRGDVVLTNGAVITARAIETLDTVNTFFNNSTSNGSSINISANNIDLLKSVRESPDQPGAAIDAGLDLDSVQTQAAGNININATGKVNLNQSGIKNTLKIGSEGSIGDINIQASTLDIQNNSVITASTSGKGNSGNINIKTTGDILISGKDIVASSVFNTSDVSGIGSNTFGQGDAGKITIETPSKLSILNRGSILSRIADTGVGNSNGISITVRELELANDASISTSISQSGKSNGNAGDINIKATGDIKISGSNSPSINPNILASSSIDSLTNGQGDTGKITINTQGKLLITNLGLIANAIGQTALGNSKGISIVAREIELSNGSFINSSTSQINQVDGTGNAGDIDLSTTGNITLSRKSIIDSSTNGRGNTGKIIINAQGKLSLDNGSITSGILKEGIGDSKGIKINAGTLAVVNGSDIQTSGFSDQKVIGKGNAGNIDIQSTGDITFSNNTNSVNGISTISFDNGTAGNISLNTKGNLFLSNTGISSASNSAGGGNITINAGNKLLIAKNSFITTNSIGTGKNSNGGNIAITSPLIVALPGNNDINGNANQGTGGNIKIVSQGLFGIQFRPKGQASPLTNDITASSTFGQDGAVNIDTPGTDPGKDSTELPNVTTDASNQISQVCSASNRQNKLTVTGRGGLPPNANDPLISDVVWQDARAASPQPVATNPKANPAKLAAPAVSWIFDGKGKVTLVAAATQGQPTGTSAVCPQTK